MVQKNTFLVVGMALAIVLSALTLPACSKSRNPSDSIITGEIKDIRQQTTGYPWEVDVLIQSSESVDSKPSATEGKEGQVITAKTDEDLNLFKVGQTITARVKYLGDVPQPGISLYIYDVNWW
jgi:hypothetical protein